MGIGKKTVTHRGKKVVERATDGIPIIGDLVDDAIQSGPMDRADDSLGRTKDRFDGGKDDGPLGKQGKKKDKGLLGRKDD